MLIASSHRVVAVAAAANSPHNTYARERKATLTNGQKHRDQSDK